MKNSKEKNETPNEEKARKHNLRLVWKSDNPKPNSVRLEFIGELAPRSNKRIPVITARADDWDVNDGNKQ